MAVDAAGGLTFVFDENLGGILEIMRMARVHPVGMLTNLHELGFRPGTPDEVWISDLGERGGHVVVTRDGRILNAAVRREAWRASGIRLLLLDGKWGQMPIRDIVRALFYWWPLMVQYAQAGSPGTVWKVSRNVPEPAQSGIQLVGGVGF
jgi:hypothetical protein